MTQGPCVIKKDDGYYIVQYGLRLLDCMVLIMMPYMDFTVGRCTVLYCTVEHVHASKV